MADWQGMCRSNYFRVKDVEAFKQMLERFPATLIEKDGRVGFITAEDHGAIPFEEGHEDLFGTPITDLIAEHLAENEVCIVMEAGCEKARYISGLAEAIAWTGERVSISLNNIYDLAQDEFGGDAQITGAEY